jgi:hypothetical protein
LNYEITGSHGRRCPPRELRAAALGHWSHTAGGTVASSPLRELVPAGLTDLDPTGRVRRPRGSSTPSLASGELDPIGRAAGLGCRPREAAVTGHQRNLAPGGRWWPPQEGGCSRRCAPATAGPSRSWSTRRRPPCSQPARPRWRSCRRHLLLPHGVSHPAPSHGAGRAY